MKPQQSDKRQNGEPARAFIDTEVFVRHSYDFGRDNLHALRSLGAAGKVEILMPEVTRLEIEADLKEMLDKAKARALNLVRTCPDLAEEKVGMKLQSDSLWEYLESQRLENFKDFCEAGAVAELPLDDVIPSEVFAGYFDGTPPFEEKGKSQFPDAFAARGLEAYCRRHKCTAVVVSGDTDWAEICKQSSHLGHCERLGEFLSGFRDPGVVSDIEAEVKNRLDFITAKLRRQFEPRGVMSDNRGGRVKDFVIDELNFVRVFIPEASEGSARAEIEYEVVYVAEVAYYAPGLGWCGENGEPRGLEVDNRRLQKRESVTVDVATEYEEGDPQQVRILSVKPENLWDSLIPVLTTREWMIL